MLFAETLFRGYDVFTKVKACFLKFRKFQNRINKHETIRIEEGMQRVAKMMSKWPKLGPPIDIQSTNIGNKQQQTDVRI